LVPPLRTFLLAFSLQPRYDHGAPLEFPFSVRLWTCEDEDADGRRRKDEKELRNIQSGFRISEDFLGSPIYMEIES